MKRRRGSRGMSDATRVATWEVVGALLRYPDDGWIGALPEIRRVARAESIPFCESIAALTTEWERRPLAELQAEYVELFDLGRSCALDMSWHQFGDRRQRGLVLVNLTRIYSEHGFTPAGGELPDWLPMLLEFAASAPVQAGRALLEDWRTPIELVRTELGEKDVRYVVLFDALSATLGELDRSIRTTVERLLAEGPPGEDVGLLPFGMNVEIEQGLLPPVATSCSQGVNQ